MNDRIAPLTDEWFAELSESCDLECKLALGKDGRGEVPKDFWETYSAFANTHGGTVLLGVQEKPRGHFAVKGISDPEKVVTDLFNTLNNPSKVSINLIGDADVQLIKTNGTSIIQIKVPQASRKQRPVHLGSNPFHNNTFRRLHEGDRRCDDEAVRRMLAERVEDERDSQILKGFGWEDIDQQSLSIYRQMLKDTKPSHPFLDCDEFGLLKKLKGWRRDRQTGDEGLTLAGLLMFGTWDAIQEGAPHYFVDYQERPEAKRELRWVDRLFPDGTWSGNLFDFYRIVYRKLTNPESLKVPFKLTSGQRRDDTPVHEAIREALVNTLVHADYSERLSVLVVKRPDMLGFRNPGNMRIPISRAVKGGDSDCRNRLMHQMFLMIGLGERAGSGIPKIYSGWKWRHWRKPALYEIDEPPQTLLELRMLELMPEGVQEQLHDWFGDQFTALPPLERLILATATTEQVVSHSRIAEISTDHSHDITLALQSLVKQDMLKAKGHGRGSVYHLPGEGLPTPEDVFGASVHPSSLPLAYSDDLSRSSDEWERCSDDLQRRSDTMQAHSDEMEREPAQYTGEKDAYGRWVSSALPAPAIHQLEALKPEFLAQLKAIADTPRRKRKVNKHEMRRVIIQLCTDQFVTRSCLAQLVSRGPDALRQQYLSGMVKEKTLSLAFPQNPNDNRQAYIATTSLRNESMHEDTSEHPKD